MVQSTLMDAQQGKVRKTVDGDFYDLGAKAAEKLMEDMAKQEPAPEPAPEPNPEPDSNANDGNNKPAPPYNDDDEEGPSDPAGFAVAASACLGATAKRRPHPPGDPLLSAKRRPKPPDDPPPVLLWAEHHIGTLSPLSEESDENNEC